MNTDQSLVVRRLSNSDEEAFLKAYSESQTTDDFEFVSHYRKGMKFNELVDLLTDQEAGNNLPKGYVSSTFFQ
ncbi:MAG: hypothetical protein VX777_06990 [Chlamydiota bacterium]|nr:hypothetical protein [Chlamydiota bacterium]